ncbi:MAG: rRNA maturation RNase YbeY [Peptoniphilaceae bacterium]|nr:rRNA maturation RNase YbeY [Peptoniphilaceae bacterium]MDD7383516.1 rRNA maturation RNase YbeY [Peptoniphilaceae bacterium]MDY3738689.1 rRNA maturation RNase YbeY [Peptoniphilaceae bacterium]
MNLLIDNRDESLEINQDLIDILNKTAVEVLTEQNLDTNYEISVSFVTEEEIEDLNSKYRNIKKVTDVLSFPLEDEFYDIEENKLLGDIVICVKRAKEQAIEYGHSFEREIMYLTCHSMLHLLGYDHINIEEKDEMRFHEKKIMKNLGVFK